MDSDENPSVPAVEMAHELAPTRATSGVKRHTLLAATIAIVLATGGGIALIGDRGVRSKHTVAKLAILHLSARGSQSGATADGALHPTIMRPNVTYRLHHTGTWDNSGVPSSRTTAVFQLVRPTHSDSSVQQMARAFGLTGPVIAADGGWSVRDGSAILTVTPGDSEYNVSFTRETASATSPGSANGSPGASGGPTVSTIQPPAPQSTAAPVSHLPSRERAKEIVRSLIEVMRLGATFEYEVADGSSSVVSNDARPACPPPTPCPMLPPNAVLTRTVVAQQVVAGHRVGGLTWSFEVGNHGIVQSGYGTFATLHTLGDYPLRSVAAAYADLVHGKDGAADPYPPMPLVAQNTNAASSATNSSLPANIIDVTVRSATLNYQTWYGIEGSLAVMYIVPVYTFSGTATAQHAAQTSDWTTTRLALDTSFARRAAPPEIQPDGRNATVATASVYPTQP